MNDIALFDINIIKTIRSDKRIFQLKICFTSMCQRIVITGPSGAGKSLTLKAIAGLMSPDNGYIRFRETMLFDKSAGLNMAPQSRRFGFMFQDYALLPHLNVRQNIAFGLSRAWFNPSQQIEAEAVEYWLELFHLHPVAHQYPAELSGGQKQRTALARALAPEPRALLLDEPFAALDPDLRSIMREELDQLQQRIKIPMILISHDPLDARIFGNEVLRIQDGELLPNER